MATLTEESLNDNQRQFYDTLSGHDKNVYLNAMSIHDFCHVQSYVKCAESTELKEYLDSFATYLYHLEEGDDI